MGHENHKNIRFLTNTGPDPLKPAKLPPIQHSILGHYRQASDTAFKWRFAGGPMMARFYGSAHDVYATYYFDALCFGGVTPKSQMSHNSSYFLHFVCKNSHFELPQKCMRFKMLINSNNVKNCH